MNSAQFGRGAEAPPWSTGSGASRELFFFFLFLKENMILHWLLCSTFLLTSFLDKLLREKIFFFYT